MTVTLQTLCCLAFSRLRADGSELTCCRYRYVETEAGYSCYRRQDTQCKLYLEYLINAQGLTSVVPVQSHVAWRCGRIPVLGSFRQSRHSVPFVSNVDCNAFV